MLNGIQLNEFEEFTKLYYYRVKLNEEIFRTDDELVAMFENQPLFPCFSEQVRFFFTTFSSDLKKFLFLLIQTDNENIVKLFAVI